MGRSILIWVPAVATFGLVEWGIVMDSSILVLVLAVATFSTMG